MNRPARSNDEFQRVFWRTLLLSLLYGLVAGAVLTAFGGLEKDFQIGIRILEFHEETPVLLVLAVLFLDYLLLIALEELLFRVVPYKCALWINYGKPDKWFIGLFVLISSVLFGFAHGGVDFIPLQGVLGAVFFLYFLKSGAIRGQVRRAFWSVYALHLGYNAGVLMALSFFASIARIFS